MPVREFMPAPAVTLSTAGSVAHAAATLRAGSHLLAGAGNRSETGSFARRIAPATGAGTRTATFVALSATHLGRPAGVPPGACRRRRPEARFLRATDDRLPAVRHHWLDQSGPPRCP